MEWEPMHHWIEQNSFGLPCHVVSSSLSFFDLARKYKRLPSGRQQFCTDFLKTKPIGQFIHDYMTAHGFKTAINATGMRAEESPRRAKKLPFVLSKGKGTSGIHQPKKFKDHTVFDWLPIFDYRLDHVLKEIENAGQKLHHVYSLGFSRLSCVFCVNGRIDEHQKASELRPELAKKIIDLERELGKTYRVKQIKGKKVAKYFDEYLTSFCN
jgi:3'-phosphoadenosine 5'-phosphosulfate sulfotransferase (PAPS reductase)/FAD synthetase